ncbi:hypothetical protein [Streptomyces sp. NPDC013187]|uniref:hypothetical protein n=1 Tax=Streptomyces sp. NPDC013187 TaxID=3364865 RepID=UPI00369AF375
MAKVRPVKRAVILGLAVAAAVITLPGTAQAQSGSRICGNYWDARANGKTVGRVAKVLEVPKVENGICLRVIDHTNSIGNMQLPGYKGKVTWNPRQVIRLWTCEEAGNLFNQKYGADPCNHMNRVDLIGQVNGRHAQVWSDLY